jgi:hypothetical protein
MTDKQQLLYLLDGARACREGLWTAEQLLRRVRGTKAHKAACEALDLIEWIVSRLQFMTAEPSASAPTPVNS